jgi:alanine dehydrogenase
MTLILGRQDVENLLTMELAMDAVEEAFAEHGSGRTQIPERKALVLKEYNGVIGVMPGYLERLKAAGVKLIFHHEENPKKYGLPASAGLVIYIDPTTGMPLAIMDCAHVTRMRTGAATGVSAKYLARADAQVAGIVGTGAQGKPQIEAVCHVRPLKKVKAYDINPAATAQFLAETADLDLEIEVVDSPQEACTDVDILVTCTPARTPFVRPEWLRQGMHISAVGADMPHKRELHPGVYARADKWVTDLINQALITGEISDAISEGAISEDTLHAKLGEIVTGQRPGREADVEITVYKSTGMAIQDVATAKRVYELAKEKGIGVEMSITP